VTRSAPLPRLWLVRLPGEFGPILRCAGALSLATEEALRRELALLEPIGHPALTLNLSGCDLLDVDSLFTLFECYKRLRDRGRRLVLVTGIGPVAHLFQVVRLDWLLPVFATEVEAALTLRQGWPALPGPATWEQARAETMVHWQLIQEALGKRRPEEVLRLLTGMTPLCERAEELYREFPVPGRTRCQGCPLFHQLGGEPGDLGCRSVLDPILAAVQAGDLTAARAQVAAVIRMLQALPLPDEGEPLLSGAFYELTTDRRTERDTKPSP
jgi:anti-anti-sigma regulatory factor